MPHVYLITGANRGLGLGMATHYLTHPNNTVIAAVRDPTSTTALSATPPAPGSTLLVIKLDALSETDPFTALASLQAHGITHLDTVIANAGLGSSWLPALATTPAHMLDHFRVNAVAPLLLFQAAFPLLTAAAPANPAPKFVTLGTPVASMAELEAFPLPSMAYGTSKAACHFVTRKLHFEHRAAGLCVFTISPGWVQTPMGNGAAGAVGMSAAPLSTEEAVAGLVRVIGAATGVKDGGSFASYDGKTHAW